MSVPKIIHYCWFGGNPLPKSAKKCIQTWKKYCPDYEIILWNEENFDLSCNEYCRTMFAEKRWAFISDYARLKVVYERGGIYLDTDVELVRSLDDLLNDSGYMGFQQAADIEVATGLGFAAEAGHPFIRENMEYYERLNTPVQSQACPHITTELLKAHGLCDNDGSIQKVGGLTIYPPEYLCPKDERSGLLHKTKNTYSIHHYDASWFEESWKESKRKRLRQAKIDYILHTPNRALMALLGQERYDKLKKTLKRH